MSSSYSALTGGGTILNPVFDQLCLVMDHREIKEERKSGNITGEIRIDPIRQ